jgi:hypothetical protein
MYKTAIEHKGKFGRLYHDCELYTACEAIQGKSGGLVLTNRDNKLVAFWCDYHKRVKAGFGSTPYESDKIWNYYL